MATNFITFLQYLLLRRNVCPYKMTQNEKKKGNESKER
jgi:hypothetical protein